MKAQQKKGGKTRARALSRGQMRHKLFLMKRQDRGLLHVMQRPHLKISVDFTPLLLNSARYIVPFSKLSSSMENTHVSKYNSTIRRVLSRCVEWYTGCLCKFLQHVGATAGLKMKLKLLKIPKNEKKLTRPSSFKPLIGPGTQADHGVDSAALLPGCMRNRFRPFFCSRVSGR